jgi:hypothetical protein
MDEIQFYSPALLTTYFLNIYINISERSGHYNYKPHFACPWQVSVCLSVCVTHGSPTQHVPVGKYHNGDCKCLL